MFDARDGEFNLENVKGLLYFQLCIPVNLFTIHFFLRIIPATVLCLKNEELVFVVSSIVLTEDNLLTI